QPLEPGRDVFAVAESGFGDAAAHELAALVVARGGGFAEGAPLGDLPVAALVLLVLREPGEQFAVSLALRDFGLEGIGIDASESEEALVEGTVVVVGTVPAGEFGTTLVDHAREENVAAE